MASQKGVPKGFFIAVVIIAAAIIITSILWLSTGSLIILTFQQLTLVLLMMLFGTRYVVFLKNKIGYLFFFLGFFILISHIMRLAAG